MSITATQVRSGIALTLGVGTLVARPYMGHKVSKRDGIEASFTNLLYGIGEIGIPAAIAGSAYLIGGWGRWTSTAAVAAGALGAIGALGCTFSDRSGELNTPTDAANALLKRYDSNHDGTISLGPVGTKWDETIRQHRTVNGQAQYLTAHSLLDGADTNHDKVVSRDELVTMATTFWKAHPDGRPQTAFVNNVLSNETWQNGSDPMPFLMQM